MGADQPDDADVPPDGHADHQDDQDGTGDRAARAGNAPAETRDRQEYYAQLRVTVSRQESAAAQRTTAEEQAAAEKWNETAEECRWMWAEYQRKWPPGEPAPVDRSGDSPDSRPRDRNRLLDEADDNRVEAECDRIAKREEDKISPALRAIESQDPDRHLIGFDDRLKGRDRLKEKVYSNMEEFDFSPEEAVKIVPDTIRYTFEYRATRYTQGVWVDVERLKDQGFELHQLKNYWSDDQYKSINSQWIEPDSGQRFEVQFHTRVSYEAKQLTHSAYERLRMPQPQKPDKFEQMVLEAFQKKVAADVPIPFGAADIPDYP